MADVLVKIDGKVYKRSDLSRVSALVLLRASEELPTLGLTTTWDDLVALVNRSSLPREQQGEWSRTDEIWLAVFTVWATLNAAGVETTLRQAMDYAADLEIIQAPEDHAGKAKAPASRKGSGRGGASPVRKAAKTRS